jgi:phage terminase large subunit
MEKPKGVEIPEVFSPLFKPKRFKILFGGRGGAKTQTIARVLLTMGAQKNLRMMCIREYMKSISDSVHSTFTDCLDSIDFNNWYEYNNSSIKGANGTLVTYSGLNKVGGDGIKSASGIDIAWVEEAENITSRNLNKVLIPTIREEGSELWFSFNPDVEWGAVYTRFVKPHIEELRKNRYYEDEDCIIIWTNLDDNPFATIELLKDSIQMKKDSYSEWLHVYGGEVYSDYTKAIILPEWVDAAIDAHKKISTLSAEGVKCGSFDVADEGADKKAYFLRHGSVITKGHLWKHGDINDAINQAWNYQMEYVGPHHGHMVFDADGLGAGFKVGLKERREGTRTVITPFRGNGKKDHPYEIYRDNITNQDRFRNKRAQYYYYLRDRFEATFNALKKGVYTDPTKLISLSSDIEDLETLKTELVTLHRKVGANSYLQVESKEEMRKRGVRSPNAADAVMMSFANDDPGAFGNSPSTLKRIDFEPVAYY